MIPKLLAILLVVIYLVGDYFFLKSIDILLLALFLLVPLSIIFFPKFFSRIARGYDTNSTSVIDKPLDPIISKIGWGILFMPALLLLAGTTLCSLQGSDNIHFRLDNLSSCFQ